MRVVKPYLVQRAKIKDDVRPSKKISENIETDYMGSAEFEFGALPKSLRAIHGDLSLYHIIQVKEIVDDKGNPLIVWSKFPFENLPEYVEHLVQMRLGKLRLKESSRFDKDYALRFKNQPEWSKTDFWWDLDNDAMFSFKPSIMKVLADSVRVSVAYMDEQRAKDAVAVSGSHVNKGIK